ncbi:MAG: zinc ribbon domain-containing protein, partial [Acidobacteriota bacterium]|nr:zinc ribbon domain-containing protein [Acidobacteriota bacterium]
ALCSLAQRGHPLQAVRQFEDGCLLIAKLPSDIWSFAGDLLVGVRKSGEGTHIEGATEIEGQAFDWGKSSRCLRTLFEDIQNISG